MQTQEGVIKFQLEHTAASPLADAEIREINAWRRILFQLGLIGQDPARYGGYGYGNISCRLPPWDAAPERRCFVITGTQTGDWSELTAVHYTVVRACYPKLNKIESEGPLRPSSESLTHGTVYALDDCARWVMHAHSPHIWRHARALRMPCTRGAVPYGTPEMADEVCRLFRESDVAERRIFVMGGHEDGVVTFGQTADEAGQVMLAMLAQAYQL